MLFLPDIQGLVNLWFSLLHCHNNYITGLNMTKIRYWKVKSVLRKGCNNHYSTFLDLKNSMRDIYRTDIFLKETWVESHPLHAQEKLLKKKSYHFSWGTSQGHFLIFYWIERAIICRNCAKQLYHQTQTKSKDQKRPSI